MILNTYKWSYLVECIYDEFFYRPLLSNGLIYGQSENFDTYRLSPKVGSENLFFHDKTCLMSLEWHEFKVLF